MNFEVRPEEERDRPAVRDVLEAAFGREDERVLVDRLRAAEAIRRAWVATTPDGDVVGSLIYTDATLDEQPGTHVPGRTFTSTVRTGLGLAPLAVHPDFQRRGIGRLLVERSLASLDDEVKGERAREGMAGEDGKAFVVVLGDPGYYNSFGFEPAETHRIRSDFGELPPGVLRILWRVPVPEDWTGGHVRYHELFGP